MSETNSVIDWIDFGKVSAERDDLLSKYFFDNQVLSSVIASPSSFLILGRKGAGKTAVFKYFTENSGKFLDKSDQLTSLSFDDYNWNVHSLLVDENKAESMLYKQSWRFVILIECINSYVRWYESNLRPLPKSLDQSKALLNRIFGSPSPSIFQVIGRKLLSLSRVALPSGGLDLESGDIDSLSLEVGELSFEQVKDDATLKSSLSENIERLIALFDGTIKALPPEVPRVFICFDRVDEGWDEVSFSSSQKLIAGLVAAGDAINSQYKGKVRPIIFLREDIFDVLSINDSNKLREDCGKLLHWNKNSLVNMILYRVNYFGGARGVAKVSSLDTLFDKAEMRQRSKPTSYLIRRTMMRPRDLISLLSRVAVNMQEKLEDPFAEDVFKPEKLQCEAVYDAEAGYSEWLKKEVLDEWKVQHPVIHDLFSAIQNNGSTNITQIAFEKSLAALGKEMSRSELLDEIKFLYNNSIIGFKLGSSSEWKFKCFYPSQGFVESDEYRVHDGLVRALSLTAPRVASEE